ncbi:MAG: hypothetical protein LBQ44_00155 [Treponema sp.]|jgi:hypothetical protein|nr:hypothetical protein [Treponema sp.]
MKKTALIITDGAAGIQQTAESIAAALDGFEVTIVPAGAFVGTRLLPADIVFFGAETADPPGFAYLYMVLQHINLAGRPCGIFSGSVSALNYLRKMVHDSELTLCPDFFQGKGDVKAWTEKVSGGT